MAAISILFKTILQNQGPMTLRLSKAQCHWTLVLVSPSKHVKSGNYRPASETPSGWRFAGGPIVARDGILAGVCVIRIIRDVGSHNDFRVTLALCAAFLYTSGLSAKF